MVAVFSGEEILELTSGRVAVGSLPDEAAEISTDTRTLKEGSWFLALPGAIYDGHDFLGDAFSQGAIGCIVAERPSYPIASTSFPLIAVGDPYEAMARLARNWRRRLNTKVVVVTTNPSEAERVAAAMCFRVLSASMRAVKLSAPGMSREAVLNAILSMPDDTQAAVLEASPVLMEQYPMLINAAQPNIAVLTRGGWDHMRLTSVEAQIIEAQLKFLSCLDGKKVTAIIASTSQDLRDMLPQAFAGKIIMFGSDDAEMQETDLEAVKDREDVRALTVTPDSWAALVACHELGFDYDTIAKRLERV